MNIAVYAYMPSNKPLSPVMQIQVSTVNRSMLEDIIKSSLICLVSLKTVCMFKHEHYSLRNGCIMYYTNSCQNRGGLSRNVRCRRGIITELQQV